MITAIITTNKNALPTALFLSIFRDRTQPVLNSLAFFHTSLRKKECSHAVLFDNTV
jgi:hypothetical protein